MPKYYKLLCEDMTTHDDFKWRRKRWYEAKPGRLSPCTEMALHGYTSPLLAALLNPIHGSIARPVMYECKIGGETGCDGLKIYAKRMMLVGEQIAMHKFTREQRVVFSIHAARLVLERGKIPEFDVWADGYLAGNTAGIGAAGAAVRAARAADARAARDAHDAAARAARDARDARDAYAAAYASGDAADAVNAAAAAGGGGVYAATHNARVARAAAYAADAYARGAGADARGADAGWSFAGKLHECAVKAQAWQGSAP